MNNHSPEGGPRLHPDDMLDQAGRETPEEVTDKIHALIDHLNQVGRVTYESSRPNQDIARVLCSAMRALYFAEIYSINNPRVENDFTEVRKLLDLAVKQVYGEIPTRRR